MNNKLKAGLGLLIAPSVMHISAAPKADSRPNIVFIEVDDLNYEYLSCMGSKVNQTPNVDQLATNGVIFQNACAQGMMSGPSRNSLMTGLYPHNMGFYYNGDMRALPKDVWTFPKALQRSGYYTSWVGKCHVRPYVVNKDKTEAMRSQMGFDYVRQTMGRTVLGGKGGDSEESGENGSGKKAGAGAKNDKKNNNNGPADWYMTFLQESGYLEQFLREYPNISTLPEDVYLDGFFTKSAIEFISGYKEKKPLFMWINYSVPHDPYDVAEEYHKPFSPAQMPGTTTADFQAPPQLIRKTKPVKSESEAREHQAGVCASISFMDRQVGRVIEALKANHLYENTIIVFFSDQGVMMGDHQLEHKGTLYRQITNPSLIISSPRSYEKGKRNMSAVELRDLINTTLEIAKADPKDQSKWSNSYSLLPILTGKKESVRSYAFAENDGYAVVTDGRFRYIEGADASLLFDDLTDPKNLKNIASQHPEVVQRMSAELKSWFKQTGEPLPRKTW